MNLTLKDAQRFRLKVGVFLVLIEKGKVLLSRRFNTGIADGQHVLPMGGLEEGETATQAMIREAKEETNVTLKADELQLAHVMHRLHYLSDGGSFPQIDLFFVPASYEGPIENREPHKCDELQFYPLDALPSTTEPFILQALRAVLEGRVYSEIGWGAEEPSRSFSRDILSPRIYETTAKYYDQYRMADPDLVKGIERKLSKEKRYLDVGCGSGNYTVALFNKGYQIEGVDFSPSMLTQARTKAPHQKWTQGDMQSLPFDSGTFDGVITMNTLHYVKNSLTPTFEEMGRILKPGGALVVYAIALEQCLQFWLGHYFPFFWEIGYKALVPKDEMLKAIRDAHFTDLEIDPFFMTEHSQDLFTYACKYRPHLFLNPQIRAVMTPLQLPEYAEDVRKGCELLQKDLDSGAVYRVISEYESKIGEGYFISAKK